MLQKVFIKSEVHTWSSVTKNASELMMQTYEVNMNEINSAF